MPSVREAENIGSMRSVLMMESRRIELKKA